MRLTVAAVCVALLAVGCAQDPEVTASPTPEPTVLATECVLDGASTDEQSVPPDGFPAYLTDVRVNDALGVAPDTCARVVFEFENEVPAYSVAYEAPPFAECGSGEPVDTSEWDADAYLVARLEPASGVDLSMDPYRETYTGDTSFDVDGDILRHVRRTCDFEALLEWIVAVDSEHDFRVFTLSDPTRIVIDIAA